MDAKLLLVEVGRWSAAAMESRRSHRGRETGRHTALRALKTENERALIDLIRRWQALPPGRRTHFLRKRVGARGSAA